MTRSDAARDKAARLAQMRHAPVAEPEQAAPVPNAPAAQLPEVAPVRTKPVRVSLDLAPALFDDFGDWCRLAARRLNRGRVTNADALRAVVRKLLADEALQAEVIEALRQEGK
jgi:hypothetical protein